MNLAALSTFDIERSFVDNHLVIFVTFENGLAVHRNDVDAARLLGLHVDHHVETGVVFARHGGLKRDVSEPEDLARREPGQSHDLLGLLFRSSFLNLHATSSLLFPDNSAGIQW